MAAPQEPLINEVLNMLVDGTYGAGTHPLSDLGQGWATPFGLDKNADELENRELAFGEIGRGHEFKLRRSALAVNPFFFVFFLKPLFCPESTLGTTGHSSYTGGLLLTRRAALIQGTGLRKES